MDTIVLKFGGSSVADNEKLKIVAEKISLSAIFTTWFDILSVNINDIWEEK